MSTFCDVVFLTNGAEGQQGELIIGEHIGGKIHKTRRYGKYKTRRPRRREKW